MCGAIGRGGGAGCDTAATETTSVARARMSFFMLDIFGVVPTSALLETNLRNDPEPADEYGFT